MTLLTNLPKASCSLGAATQSLSQTIDYAKDRKQFGRALTDFQVSLWKESLNMNSFAIECPV